MLTKHGGIFRASKKEHFTKTINSFKRLNVFVTCPITDFCYGFEYVYEKMVIYHSLDCSKSDLEH